MRLATLDDGTRDGRLVVVSGDGARCTAAGSFWPTMQSAMDRWDEALPRLRELARLLDAAVAPGTMGPGTTGPGDVDLDGHRHPVEPFDPERCAAPLPRAAEWVDGSAYINHIILVRKARNAEPPKTLRTDPLVYQGGSSDLLGARSSMDLPDAAWGLDFEAEIGVILGDVPRGTTAEEAGQHIRLLVILNDWTYRNLVPPELEKGFGFFQSKPATAFSPLAVTPDELGDAWKDGRLHLKLETTLNGELVGDPQAGPEMHFSFHQLVAHIARTRRFQAGTILGSGTVSNEDRARGISCLAERRMIETIENGKPATPFLSVGDVVSIRMRDAAGREVFGRIENTVVKGEDRGRWGKRG